MPAVIHILVIAPVLNLLSWTIPKIISKHEIFLFLLSMLVVTAAVAQNLDRGIHKPSTRCSFLFGEKANDADKMDVAAYDDVVVETMAPSLVANDVAPATLLEPQFASFAIAEPMDAEEVMLTNRVLRKLNRKDSPWWPVQPLRSACSAVESIDEPCGQRCGLRLGVDCRLCHGRFGLCLGFVGHHLRCHRHEAHQRR